MESSIINGTMLIWIPILAVIFLGERITEKELIGLALAGIGTLLVQLRRSVILLRLWKRNWVREIQQPHRRPSWCYGVVRNQPVQLVYQERR
jgi:drug/metabolite transporter (DMT)-like permease